MEHLNAFYVLGEPPRSGFWNAWILTQVISIGKVQKQYTCGLGVGKLNKKAIKFYERLGSTVEVTRITLAR